MKRYSRLFFSFILYYNKRADFLNDLFVFL